jgi:ubiquinol-cytochrome c reductase cytochrome c1 subunit
MTDHWIVRLACAAALMFGVAVADAAEGAKTLQAGNDLSDRASLQRGAQLYMNYCSGCHALKYLRYSRMAADLGLSEEEVMNNLNFTGTPVGEPIPVTMPKAQAEKWFGKMPPDLSLISRVRGSDWVYTYLKSFYLDPTRPLGWNNTVFPNASMPNPLWEMQGLQHAVHGKPENPGEDPPVVGLKIEQPGNMDPGQYDQLPGVRRRAGRAQAAEAGCLGDPVPGAADLPGLSAQEGILEGRPLSRRAPSSGDRSTCGTIALLAFVMCGCTLGYCDDRRQWAGGADTTGGYRTLESL